MAFAIQYIERKGTNGGMNYGGYIINDGTHSVFVSCGTKDNTRPLFNWLGNGDYLKGKAIHSTDSLSLPDVLLSASQYNVMVASMDVHSVIAFKGGCL